MTRITPQTEIEELRARLAEAEDALAAIREGRVDALVVDGRDGPQVFSLARAETIYRHVVETMGEAALNVTPDGTLLFCNERFSAFVATPMPQLLGRDLSQFIVPEDRTVWRTLLERCTAERVKQRLTFCGPGKVRTPALLLGNALTEGDSVSLCFVATDLTELEDAARQIEQLRQTQMDLRASRHAALNLMEDAQAARYEAERVVAALGESEAREHARATLLQTVLNTSPAPIWVALDSRCERIVGNPAGEALLGAPHGANVSMSAAHDKRYRYRCLRDGKDVPAEMLPMQRAAREGVAVTAEEYEVIRGDGSHVWLLMHASPLVEDGQVGGAVAVAVDITARKQAEEALRTSEEFHLAIAELSSDWAFSARVEADGTVVTESVTEGFTKMFGYTAAEMMAAGGWQIVVYPEDVPYAAAQMERLLAGEVIAGEMRHITKDGQVIWLEFQTRPVCDETGRVVRLYGASTDITERIQAEEKLRRSNELFSALAKHAPVGIFRTDAEGQCIYVNEWWMQITDLSWADALGTGWTKALQGFGLPGWRRRKTICRFPLNTASSMRRAK